MEAFLLKRSFGISVGLHALLVLALIVGLQVKAPSIPTPRKLTWIEVEPMTTKRTADIASPSKQVVRTDRGQTTDRAKPDAFLGERTQTVEHAQVSRTQTGDQTMNSTPKVAKKAETRPRENSPKIADEKISAPTPTPTLSALGVALPKPGLTAKDLAADQEQVGSPAAQAKGEFVKGFKAGERTLLNTREYVFYGYFQRIREKLDRAWERSLKERLDKYFRRGRQLASESDYTTQLLVTLDQQGQVTRVQNVGASGTRDLDEAAIKAFNEAGPFPNPPRGLVEASGEIQVRWDFVLRT